MAYEGIVKKSRTLDFNTALLLCIPLLTVVEANVGMLQGFLGEKTYPIVAFSVAMLSAAGNIYLRFKTTTAVGEK